MDKICCANCGYLAARDFESREIKEVEIGMRKDWKMPPPQGSQNKYEEFPICFVGAAEFEEEIGTYDPKKVTETIRKARPDCDCDGKFTEWQHGSTPVEHRQMLLNAKMLEEQRAWQAEQNRMNRKIQYWLVAIAMVSLLLNFWVKSTTPATPAQPIGQLSIEAKKEK